MLNDAYFSPTTKAAEAQLGASDRKWQGVNWTASSTHQLSRFTVVSVVEMGGPSNFCPAPNYCATSGPHNIAQEIKTPSFQTTSRIPRL